jgi:hypothetical protein
MVLVTHCAIDYFLMPYTITIHDIFIAFLAEKVASRLCEKFVPFS